LTLRQLCSSSLNRSSYYHSSLFRRCWR